MFSLYKNPISFVPYRSRSKTTKISLVGLRFQDSSSKDKPREVPNRSNNRVVRDVRLIVWTWHLETPPDREIARKFFKFFKSDCRSAKKRVVTYSSASSVIKVVRSIIGSVWDYPNVSHFETRNNQKIRDPTVWIMCSRTEYGWFVCQCCASAEHPRRSSLQSAGLPEKVEPWYS